MDALLLPESNTKNAIANPHYSILPTDRILVYKPIWSGLVINTILFALIIWLLTLVPPAVYRTFRRKRGLCIKCGYDLRGTSEGGCPECGLGQAEVKT